MLLQRIPRQETGELYHRAIMMERCMLRRTITAMFIVLMASPVFGQGHVRLQEAWGRIDYKGRPWVENISKPLKISQGLQNRHISLWASHGMYYDQTKDMWKWQRPYLFSTTEDLYTQTIVIPYLIPMLEKAGAVVFTPRERDWQKQEIIVDNDTHPAPQYLEVNTQQNWTPTNIPGFAQRKRFYFEGDNPFRDGTARMTLTTKNGRRASLVSYQPDIPEAGRYAVYVSYQTLKDSAPDVQYIVYHKGEQTEFRVNQQMGGGTWVYLGTFDFDAGCNEFNRIVVTNYSKTKKAIVTTDAVRLGGGMGNIVRGDDVSHMPRCLEGARYYAQWAGAPTSVYSSKAGTDDYSDDINVRSMMTNWLGGGSIYMPSLQGLHVPIELSLAVHSDAGYKPDGASLVGPLSICTTSFNDGRLNSGISRMTSKDFAANLLDNLIADLQARYNCFEARYLWDRNYSETRLPEVPSAILETLSHQSFPDMRYGQDPNFRFTLARSVYKTILKYICQQHGRTYVVEPLPPVDFSMQWVDKDHIKLSWRPQEDTTEPTAKPQSYLLYTSRGRGGFDNGQLIERGTTTTIKLEPGIQYNFKVTACNKGGESFPTETLTATYNPYAEHRVLIVNGFSRLSSPAIVNNAKEQGFDLSKDIGVSYGLTAGYSGQQTCYDISRMGKSGENGLGYSGNELSGHFISGNTFDYCVSHAAVISSNQRYTVASTSVEAIERGEIDLRQYDAIDLIMGLQRNDGHSLVYYKTFTPLLQKAIREYTNAGGKILVSGAYIGSDMQENEEQAFLRDVLHVNYATGDDIIGNRLNGLGRSFSIVRQLNHRHYAVQHPEVLAPVGEAFCAIAYEDGRSAGVAWQGPTARTFTMGFPLECIEGYTDRADIMQGILAFLLPY